MLCNFGVLHIILLPPTDLAITPRNGTERTPLLLTYASVPSYATGLPDLPTQSTTLPPRATVITTEGTSLPRIENRSNAFDTTALWRVSVLSWTILCWCLDIIIVAPSILSGRMYALLDEDDHDRTSQFLGFWFFMTIVLSIVTGLLGVIGPFTLFNTLFLLSFIWYRIICALAPFKTGRVCLRATALGVLLMSLWIFVDVRKEFRSADFPVLDNSTSSIRILDLYPANSRWEIQADLRTVQLEDHPSFEALSYEWGDQRRSHTIIIGGKRFRVTANLWKALHNVRHERQPRPLWVDALSIDQENMDEKSAQVPLMSLIYRRAETVLVSLGKHALPHWIRDSDPATWTSSWRKDKAQAYWETTSFWLRRLMLEEYWKRCWVVQELGSGMKIDIYAERKPIPWSKFIDLVDMYASTYPTAALPNRVLRFETLRQALYRDGRTYALTQLLEDFKDSFCSVKLDKILAFTGMAVDCSGDCLPVNYTAGPLSLYKSIIAFQNASTSKSSDSAIEMVHFAALVRRLLSRKHTRTRTSYKKPGWLYLPETWTYYWCGDENVDLCLAGPEFFLVFPLLEFLRAPFSANKDLEIMTSRWSKDTAEQKQAWIGGFEGELGPMKALGKVVSTVRELGPTYRDYLGSPYAVHQWSAALSHAYPSAPDQRRVRGLNARLSALLGPAADYRNDDVAASPNIEGPDHLSTGARLFLGGDKPTLGLVPSVARVGDFICQFWNASTVAVLRVREDGAGYAIVGRGTMLQEGEEIDWDIPLNKTIFQPNATGTVEFDLDLDLLSFLSFDAVNLPGAAE